MKQTAKAKRHRSRDGLGKPQPFPKESASSRSPAPGDVTKLREAMKLTQAQFGDLVYRSLRIVQYWETGQRQCPADTWEYLNLLARFPTVRRCRKLWIEGQAVRRQE